MVWKIWFDGEVLEKLNSRDKLFQKFKKSRLPHWQRVVKESEIWNVETDLNKKAGFC